MPEFPINEEKFKEWIMSFHRLRIQGFFSDSEKDKINTRIHKAINKAGYTVEDIGFYEYKFTKIEK